MYPMRTPETALLTGISERYNAALAALSAATYKSTSGSQLNTMTVICVG